MIAQRNAYEKGRYVIEHTTQGVFTFYTPVTNSILVFKNVAPGTVLLHDKLSSPIELFDGLITFPYAGEYNIRGAFEYISIDDMYSTPFQQGSTVLRWHDTETRVIHSLFAGSHLEYLHELPSTVENVDSLFFEAPHIPSLRHLDTSNIMVMSSMFESSAIDQDLDTWDTSRVVTMQKMFAGAEQFNGKIDTWDVSNVMFFHDMFAYATVFDQCLNAWDTRSAENMSMMFSCATSFNNQGYPLQWDTSSVQNMWGMFYNAEHFNQDVSSWDVSNVWIMNQMFKFATSFNNGGAEFSTWDTSNVEGMIEMFRGALAFNQDISLWDTSAVYDVKEMFYDAESFCHDLSTWTFPNVINPSFFAMGSPIDDTEYMPRFACEEGLVT